MWVCVYPRRPWQRPRALDPPGIGLTGDCESPDADPGNPLKTFEGAVCAFNF